MCYNTVKEFRDNMAEKALGVNKIKKIRAKLFPASSRYFGQEMSQIKADLKRISDENRRLQELIECQKWWLESILKNQEVAIKKIDLYSTQIYRNNGETNFDARARLFAALPEATGVLALYQSVNTKLLRELSDICIKNGLKYWLWSGSAVAVAARGKSIPWDDDIDICMMRDDFEKLKEKVKDSKEYQISIVHDFLARNRQYRFVSKDPNIYNFVDIVVCDWCVSDDLKLDAEYKKLKREMEEEFISRPDLGYWRDIKYFFNEGSSFTYQYVPIDMNSHDQKRVNSLIPIIDEIFDEYMDKARDMKILCNEKKARAIAYGLDGLFNVPRRRDLWSRDIIFPTHMTTYEDIKVGMPHDEKRFCEICFPEWPYIPNDICNHSHIPEDVINDVDNILAMERFIKK